MLCRDRLPLRLLMDPILHEALDEYGLYTQPVFMENHVSFASMVPGGEAVVKKEFKTQFALK